MATHYNRGSCIHCATYEDLEERGAGGFVFDVCGRMDCQSYANRIHDQIDDDERRERAEEDHFMRY